MQHFPRSMAELSKNPLSQRENNKPRERHRDQFQIGSIWETRQRHFCRVIGVRPAILALDAGRSQRLLHFFNTLARDCHVIDVKLLRHEGEGDERAAQKIAHHL